MKEINFLIRLKKEGKIEVVKPNEEIKESYIKKSESNLASAKILLENNKFEESVSLIYYSMYNLLLALLFKIGIKSENHTGSIIILKEIFKVDNSKIYKAKKERIDKQYYIDFTITQEEVEKFIKKAESFNEGLNDFISKINNKDIMRYRDKLNKLLK